VHPPIDLFGLQGVGPPFGSLCHDLEVGQVPVHESDFFFLKLRPVIMIPPVMSIADVKYMVLVSILLTGAQSLVTFPMIIRIKATNNLGMLVVTDITSYGLFNPISLRFYSPSAPRTVQLFILFHVMNIDHACLAVIVIHPSIDTSLGPIAFPATARTLN
jgi:hypothetical protein